MDSMQLLVVEADEHEANLLKANLERRGARVSVAPNPAVALEWLDAEPVDAVLTDLDPAAFAFLREIRVRDATLPVVILTEHATIERAAEGIRAGATDLLPKPVHPDVMISLLDRWIRPRSSVSRTA